jgi:hypothetical protein
MKSELIREPMPMNFVAPVCSDEQVPIWILACDADCIIAFCDTLDDASRLVHLGFQNAPGHGDHIAVLRRVADDIDKATSLMVLRDLGILSGFAPAGWPPYLSCCVIEGWCKGSTSRSFAYTTRSSGSLWIIE